MSLWETFKNATEGGVVRTRNSREHKRPKTTETAISSLLQFGETGSYIFNVRETGQALLRKRAFACSRNDCFADGTKVVYRRREDWSRQQAYAKCQFLDDFDTVIACDLSGKIDVIRLPLYEKTEKPRKLGTVLIDSLETSPHDNPTVPSLKSLRSNGGFVVGMGESYHICASERMSTWGDDLDLKRTHWSHHRRSNFLSAVWRVDGPRRKYHRCRENSQLSLPYMASTGNLATEKSLRVQEIEGWNREGSRDRRSMSTAAHLLASHRPRNEPKWDFLETGSSLLSAHIDPEHDCFWLKLIDDRIHEPVVHLDLTSLDTRPHFEESITGCAFVSDNCLMTAHVCCGSEQSDENGATAALQYVENKVKVWDIRMMRSKSKKGICLSAMVLPHFPEAESVAALPEVQFNPTYSKTKLYETSKSILSGITSSESRGTVVLTFQSNKSPLVEHYLLDPSRMEVKDKFSQRVSEDQFAFAVADSHNILACTENLNEIKIYDMQKCCRHSSRGKRRVNGIRLEGEKRVEPLLCLRPVLKDSHGLDTNLSCISLNRSGTSLLGGSVDGDLFVWRGL